MAKIRTSFTLSAEAIEALKKLAKKHGRSNANMLEVLVLEAASKELTSSTPSNPS